MKENKEKIEFWLHTSQKNALKVISEKTGYSVAELMRRGVEYIIKDLHSNFILGSKLENLSEREERINVENKK